MTEPREPDVAEKENLQNLNPGYPAFQLAKALIVKVLGTPKDQGDPAARARAAKKAAKWKAVLKNLLTSAVEYGSRTPLEGVPAWVTTEVLTGGFVTGELLAGGPLQPHEKDRLSTLPPVREGDERRALNLQCLTDEGMARLMEQLRTGCYDVTVPEEGALLVVAWLADQGHVPAARELIEQLSPFFSRLRFYPVLLPQPRRFGSRVHLQTVADVIDDLRAIRPNAGIMAQRDAVQIWMPLHDRIVGMFLETVSDGWPCHHYPADWKARASSLLDEYDLQKSAHPFGGKHERRTGHQAQLRQFLRQCATDPAALTGRDVGRIRTILNRYLQKRGAPNGPRCHENRRRQRQDVQAPLFDAIAAIVIERLEQHRE